MTSTSRSGILLRGLRKQSARSDNDPSPWEQLEHFVDALRDADQTRRQVHLMLQITQQGIHADAVFWLPRLRPEETALLSDHHLNGQWCRNVVDIVLRHSVGVDGQLVCSDLARLAPLEETVWPTSAAIVRISRHFDTWLAAVSFNSEHVFGDHELRFMRLARRMLLHHREQLQLGERQKQTLFEMVHAFTASIDAKDPYTCGHSERVGRIAVRIAKEMGLREKQISDLYLAGLLHDIGKIGVPDAVLRKPAALSQQEFAQVKQHPVTGDQIVSRISQFKHLSAGVRNHHERHDGQGYPDGLAGEQIPLMARILAVADSCDAMMSDRPYRPGMVPKVIDEIMTGGAGSQWDPDVVDSFLRCRREAYSICQKGLGQSVRRAIDCTVDEHTQAQGSLHRYFEGESTLP